MASAQILRLSKFPSLLRSVPFTPGEKCLHAPKSLHGSPASTRSTSSRIRKSGFCQSFDRSHRRSAIHATSSASSEIDSATLEDLKGALLKSIRGSERGSKTDPEQRAIVEEAQIELERYGGEVVGNKLNELNGLWRLCYTTAPDVISIFQPSNFLSSILPFPVLQVGDIYQRFECSQGASEGIVENIIKFSIAGILQENEGATLTVKAKFSVQSNRSIQLGFEEVMLSNIQISPSLETIITPALLPRTQISMEILQFLRGFEISLPLLRPSSSSSSSRALGRSPYMLTYLDENLLVGRAISPPGNFIFERAN